MSFVHQKDGFLSTYYREAVANTDESEHVYMLHGNSFSGMCLAPMAEQLPKHWHVHLNDLPGHGLSDALPDMPPIDCFVIADQLSRKLEALQNTHNLPPMIGLSHSVGAAITLLMAYQRPHVFKRLVLLDPIICQPSFIYLSRLLQWLGLIQHTPLVKGSRSRRAQWPSVDEAMQSLSKKALYRHWHPEALEQFAHTCLRAHANGAELVCTPDTEADFFASTPVTSWSAIKHLSVPTTMVLPKESYFFVKPACIKAARDNALIELAYFGERHCFPMEEPYDCAQFLCSSVLSDLVSKR